MYFTETAEGVILNVRAQPRSSKAGIDGLFGADAVKVFPAGNLGPGYIKAVKAPLSHIPLMAVGGVNEKNAADFMKAGCVGLGVGGNLVNKDWIENGEWEKITALAKEFMKAVNEG